MSIEKLSSEADSRFIRGFHGRAWIKILPWLCAGALLPGCARHYDMTLTNGSRITNVSKPVLNRDQGAFYYKDVAGNVHHVSSGRVVEIKPHSNKNTTPGTLLQ